MATLAESEWDARFTEIVAPSGDSLWTAEELQDAGHLVPTNRTWTLVDGDNGYSFIITGFHRINAISYIVSEQPWESEDIDNEWIVK